MSDVDVVVVGGGMAGMVAAATAADEGARVLVVEKSEQLGGSAALSAGILWAAPDYDTLRRFVPLGDPELGRMFVDAFAEGVQYVRDTGVEVGERTGGHMGYGFGHQIDIHGFIARLRARAESAGGSIAMGTAVRALLHEDGAVRGIRVDDGDGESEVRAGAVVIATGGFQGDRELVAAFLGPGADDMLVRSNPGSVGDGLRMGRAAGAAVSAGMSAFYGHLVPAPLDDFGEPQYVPLTQYHSNRSLLVNLHGRRFMDESRGDEHAVQEVLRQPGARAFLLTDERVRREYVVTAPYPGGQVVDRFTEAAKAGAPVEQADTVEELVDVLAGRGVPAANLRATLDGYAAAAAGRRAQVDAPLPAAPTPLVEPPFYALLVQPALTFTHGGLRVDVDCRVLDRDGRPIPGLHAAGADAGGLHNVGYAGGLSSALVLGRRAGRSAAAARSQRQVL